MLTYNVVGLSGLALGGSERLPLKSGGVASVPYLENVEWDGRLRAVACNEFGAVLKGEGVDGERVVVSSVSDNVDGRAVVYEVLGQDLVGKLESVASDELSEDLSGLSCLSVINAESRDFGACAVARVRNGFWRSVVPGRWGWSGSFIAWRVAVVFALVLAPSVLAPTAVALAMPDVLHAVFPAWVGGGESSG